MVAWLDCGKVRGSNPGAVKVRHHDVDWSVDPWYFNPLGQGEVKRSTRAVTRMLQGCLVLVRLAPLR